MIQFVGVSKFYKDIPAVQDISFSIDTGEFVTLSGHSGSGKSTLIKMIIREIVPSDGRVVVDNDDLKRMGRGKVYKLRRKVGVVFQDFKLIYDKNVYENVAFALEARGRKDKEIKDIVPYVLEIVGLDEKMKSFPHELSGGQKQKVAIARAVANDPKVLIADEPTGNLDDDATWEIVDIIRKINEWGTTVIMATHNRSVINVLDHREIVLEKGKLVKDTKENDEEFGEKVISEVEKEEKIVVKTKSAEKLKKDIDKEKIKIKKETKENKKNKENKNSIKVKPKLKIGLLSKKKVGNSSKQTKVKNDKSFKDFKLDDKEIKILEDKGYSSIQDVMNAGMEKIETIDEFSKNQIKKIQEALDAFIKQE